MICDVIQKHGKIRKVDRWGKKRLSYEIQKKQYGYYAAIEFEGDGSIPKELESEYNFNDKVIRFLTYLYDKRKMQIIEKEMKAAAPVSKSAPEPQEATPPVKTEKVEPVPEDTEEKNEVIADENVEEKEEGKEA